MPPASKNDTPVSAEPEVEITKKSKMSNMTLFLILVGIVLLEVVLAAFILPSPSKVKSEITPVIEEEINQKSSPQYKISPNAIKPEEKVEKDLGDFNLSEQGAGPRDIRISTHFYALVNKSDEAEFDKKYAEHQNRIRNAILVILRSTPGTELDDPVLGVVRNKILVKVNEILGAPLVKGVIFTELAR